MLEKDSAKRNKINHVVEALYELKIAVESLNPDPTKTIAEHERSEKIQT